MVKLLNGFMLKMNYKKSNTILDEICENKILEIEARIRNVSFKELENEIEDMEFEPCSFCDALKKEEMALIAEIKKSSPSNLGKVFRENFNVAEIAKIYETSGASAISVITDEKFFMGKLENLKITRENCNLPILRKDFILDSYQIYEAKIQGADAILLIATILERNKLKELYDLAEKLNLDVLVEAHNAEELEEVLSINPKIIGINNRDLKNMKLDLNNFQVLAKLIPGGIIKVAESGIKTREDVLKMREAGADAVLVGTELIKAEDIGQKIVELLNG